MRSLVIGGCGFIGSHIVDALRAENHSVRVLDRQAERHRPPLRGVDYMFGDFSDRMSVAEALTGVEVVYHAASTTFPSTANLDPASDVQDNLISTLRVLDLMRGMGIKKIVYLSSGGTIYGPPEVTPTPEEHPLRPINSYGIVKAAVEHYLMMYHSLYGVSAISIRASNPYGERQGHSGVQGVISTFLNRISLGDQIEIWGDGTVVRDYLHVADLARACVLAGQSDYSGPINIGSGQGHSLNDILETLRTLTKKDLKVTYTPARPTDVKRSVLDVTRAKDTLDWSTEISLADGLSRNWEWLKSTNEEDGDALDDR